MAGARCSATVAPGGWVTSRGQGRSQGRSKVIHIAKSSRAARCFHVDVAERCRHPVEMRRSSRYDGEWASGSRNGRRCLRQNLGRHSIFSATVAILGAFLSGVSAMTGVTARANDVGVTMQKPAPTEGFRPTFLPVIPAPSFSTASFVGLYQDVSGKMVMAYDFGMTEGDRVYFSDGHSHYPRSDRDAARLANSASDLLAFEKKNGLRSLPVQFFDAQLGEVSYKFDRFSGTNCQWPFAQALRISRPDRFPLDLLVVRKLDHPKKELLNFYCEISSGTVQVVVNYESVGWGFYSDEANSVLALILQKPSSVFFIDPLGISIDRHLGPGVTVLQANLSKALYGLVSSGKLSPQAAIDMFENDVFSFQNSRAGVMMP